MNAIINTRGHHRDSSPEHVELETSKAPQVLAPRRGGTAESVFRTSGGSVRSRWLVDLEDIQVFRNFFSPPSPLIEGSSLLKLETLGSPAVRSGAVVVSWLFTIIAVLLAM
jgi:hypothetical protein